MKKILAAIIAVAFVMHPAVCVAAYIIHLKNGREFVTKQYWEEGEQIKFKRYGGIIGIQKDLVKNIEEADDLPMEKDEAYRQKVNAPAEKLEEKAKEIEGATNLRPEKESPVKKSEEEKTSFLEEKRRILAEFKAVREDFAEAKAKKDKKKKDEYWKKILLLQKELSGLRKQVMADNEGVLPPWWDSVR